MTENQEKSITLPKLIVQNSRTMNQVLTLENIAPQFQNHIVIINGNDRKKDVVGIADYIVSILKSHGACFSEVIENDILMRRIVVKGGMFSEDIIKIVRKNFTEGTSRYSPSSIRVYLSAHLGKKSVIGIQKNRVGKIRLKGNEDFSRTCSASRCKYYAID